MRASFSSAVAVASLFGALAAAQNASSTSSGEIPEYTLQAENITAKFIPYGARLTSLVVPDRDGTDQDIVVGYDSPEDYVRDSETNHTFFGKKILLVRQISH
jgi:aldose 1-epimerase